MSTFDEDISWIEDSSDPNEHTWKVSLKHSPFDSDNFGIPINPFVYKVYISLEALESINDLELAEGQGAFSDTELKEKIKEIVQNISSYVRPARTEDISLKNVDNLVDEVFSKITINWYGNDLGFTQYAFQSITNNQIEIIEQEDQTLRTHPGVGYPSRYPLLQRDPSNEHLHLEGWYYFTGPELTSIHRVYDYAEQTLNTAKHVLDWKTRDSENGGYSPISSGIVSIIPVRNFSSGGTIASSLTAGDTVRISISGGSGDFSFMYSNDQIEPIGDTNRVWRIITNSTVTVLMEIEDNQTADTVVLEFNVEKGT